MNTKHLSLRVAALVGSVLLLSGYVYERAGGQLLEKVGLKEPAPATEPTHEMEMLMLSGSKSAPVVMPTDPPLIHGSKSAILVAPTVPQSEPVEVAPVRPQTTLLPGSKSLIIADPPATTTTLAPSNNPPPSVDNPPPRLLPGSKADVLAPPITNQFNQQPGRAP